jgi:DNA replication protein DnaC
MFYELDIVKPIVTLQFVHYYFSMKGSLIPNEFLSNAHYQQAWTSHFKNEVWSALLNQKAQQKLNGTEKSTIF